MSAQPNVLELNHYLHKYKEMNRDVFAVAKIGGACMDQHLDDILEDLTLLKDEGLNTIVVFGWGEQLTQRLSQAGHQAEFVNGKRVTDEITMQHIHEIISQYKGHVQAHDPELPFLEGIIHAQQSENEQLGRVGSITGIDTETLIDTLQKKQVAFMPPLGFDGEQYLNINADTVGRALVEHTKPAKYIALTPTGGIYDTDGSLMRKISILDDYESVSEAVSGGMRTKLDEAKQLLKNAPKGFSVQLTSPEHLKAELFSYEGAGTKISYGYQLHHMSESDNYNHEQVKSLIENSFNKCLREDYFTDPHSLILEEDYDGVAVIKEFVGWLLLDKFAVAPDAQGGGLGSKLFSETVSCYENGGYRGLCFRSFKKSMDGYYDCMMAPYNGGSHSTEHCTAYWITEKTSEIPWVIEQLNKRPTDWI